VIGSGHVYRNCKPTARHQLDQALCIPECEHRPDDTHPPDGNSAIVLKDGSSWSEKSATDRGEGPKISEHEAEAQGPPLKELATCTE